MNAERLFSHRIGRVLTALTAMFLWGSAFPVIKWGYDSLQIASKDTGQQILFAGYRFFLAALMILVVFFLLNGRPRFQRKTFLPLVWIGLFQTFLQYALFYIGLAYSTGIQGSILAGTTSFFQILFARWMVPDEPITRRKILGLLIGFGGVVVVNLHQESMEFSLGWGALLLLMAMMSSAFGNLLARKGAARMDVAYLTGYQMLFGSLGLILTGVLSGRLAPFLFQPGVGGHLVLSSFFVRRRLFVVEQCDEVQSGGESLHVPFCHTCLWCHAIQSVTRRNTSPLHSDRVGPGRHRHLDRQPGARNMNPLVDASNTRPTLFNPKISS